MLASLLMRVASGWTVWLIAYLQDLRLCDSFHGRAHAQLSLRVAACTQSA